MPYDPQTWVDFNSTYPVSAARMNHLEQGVEDAHALLDAGVVVRSYSAAHTLEAQDFWKTLEFDVGSTANLVIPPDSELLVPDGTLIELFQVGAGRIYVYAGAGVTILSRANRYETAGQYASAMLRKRPAANNWALFGDLA